MSVKSSCAAQPWQSFRLRLGNQSYGQDNLAELLSLNGFEGACLEALHAFLSEWFAPRPTMWLQTSGSTGEPKRIEVRKEYMLCSAEMSCRYFGLGREDVALLCMDLRYIGAMMLVVRTMVCGMRLVLRPPSSMPLSDRTLHSEGLTFASLVPLQVFHALECGEPLLSRIGQIIIGGATVPVALREQLRGYPNRIYASYGMTETLSHIALAPISRGSDQLIYQCLDGVYLSLSERQTLIVNAPRIGVCRLEVNDLVELIDDGENGGAKQRFRLLGRADLVINTGGVKVSAEALEDELAQWLAVPLAISWRASERLGQEIVLLIQAQAEDIRRLRVQYAEAVERLPQYHRPKSVLFLAQLPRLGSGKLDRQALHALASQS